MWVKITRTSAGPAGTYMMGTRHDLPVKQALHLIAVGSAERLYPADASEEEETTAKTESHEQALAHEAPGKPKRKKPRKPHAAATGEGSDPATAAP